MIDGTKLLIPLYHGTTNLFLKGIRDYGLGGQNYIENNRIIDMFLELYETYQTRLRDEEKDAILDSICKKIDPSGETSWDYGKVCLTTSRYKALNYATLNRYGSELLSSTMFLYEFVISHRKDFRLRNELHNELVNRLENMAIYPVIVKLDRMDIRSLILDKHNRGDMDSVIRLLDKYYLVKGKESGDLLQYDFQMAYGVTIPSSDVTIYENVQSVEDIMI